MNRRFVLLCFVLLAVAALYWVTRLNRKSATTATSSDVVTPGERLLAAAEIEARERLADKTFWSEELQARKCGAVFEQLWDSLNRASNKLQQAQSFPVHKIQLPGWNGVELMPHNIELRRPTGSGLGISGEEWIRLLQQCQADGWRLAQCEFRHSQFDADSAGRPLHSVFSFSAHLENPGKQLRAMIEGPIRVDWECDPGSEQKPIAKYIDASGLSLKIRAGKTPFREILNEQIQPEQGTFFIDPLIVYDLDGDGYPEIILAAKNLVYRRNSDGTYRPYPLCRFSPGLIFSGLVADFDGDGLADFMCVNFQGLVLFKGSAQGTFDEPGRLVWAAPQHLKYVTAMTCGDIDGDGDLDIFLAQYRPPYQGGSMPTPYYNANDGYPSYLLANDGQGSFSDITVSAGLAEKRFRRSYSCSMVDLMDRGSLDLIVVSDFAGLDLYRGDGAAHFTDVTSSWAGESHAFGMGHAIADFNGDGRLDLLILGMPSPTADRLEHAKAWRNETGQARLMRSRMTYGNRLYLGEASGGFEQTALNDSIARSGWSWGCSPADFDNDGYPDAYIANGHETKDTVQDYDPEFWLHDIYVADSHESSAQLAYFDSKSSRTRGRGQSYGGYDKNRLYWNLAGTNFLESGFLMGVALEQDSRNVVAADLDNDGRSDLLVTTFEVWPEFRQTLRVYRNELADCGNWIGFRLREAAGRKSPVGASARLICGGRMSAQACLTGDSYRSQHPTTLHFGLGACEHPSAEFVWPHGGTVRLNSPAPNQYHWVQAPER